MKNLLLINRSVLVFSLLIPLFVSCGSEKHEFKYVFEPGESLVYSVSSRLRKTLLKENGEADTEETESVTGKIVISPESSYEKGCWLSVGYDSLYAENSDIPGVRLIPENYGEKGPALLLNPRGDILDIRDENDLPSDNSAEADIVRMFIKAFPLLPHVSAGKGYSWDRVQEYPVENGLMKGKTKVYKKYKIESLYTEDGRQMARISTNLMMKTYFSENEEEFSIAYSKQDPKGIYGTGSIVFDVTGGVIMKSVATLTGVVAVRFRNPVKDRIITRNIRVFQKFNAEKI
ncbi:MAG: hypothetical protein ACLFQK_01785 [Fibrobacterota bacterium]